MSLMNDAQATRACEAVGSPNLQHHFSPDATGFDPAMRVGCIRKRKCRRDGYLLATRAQFDHLYLISAIRMMIGIGTPSSHNKTERMIAS
jgi:hypothetical protein